MTLPPQAGFYKLRKDKAMDTKTGDIYTPETRAKFEAQFMQAELKDMILEPTIKQLRRKPVDSRADGRVGRNDTCPCGSGKKFKKCCLTKDAG